MGFLIVLIIVFIVYAFIENKILLTVRYEKFGSGVRIAQISDIHKRRFGNGNSELCERVRKESPDMIFVTGDIISRYVTDISAAADTLKGLSSIAPVYMIYGNHEQDLRDDVRAELVEAARKCGVTVMCNDCAKVDIKGRSFSIYGIKESHDVYNINGGYRGLKTLEKSDITSYVGECPDGEVLLLAHNPFLGEAYSQWGADYTFSGHVHGGIVRIFGIGLLSPERKLFPKNSKGVYDYGGKKLLVSAGLGKFRLFNPSEIVIYDI